MTMKIATYQHDNCHVGGFVWQISPANVCLLPCTASENENIFQLANDHWPYWATCEYFSREIEFLFFFFRGCATAIDWTSFHIDSTCDRVILICWWKLSLLPVNIYLFMTRREFSIGDECRDWRQISLWGLIAWKGCGFVERFLELLIWNLEILILILELLT